MPCPPAIRDFGALAPRLASGRLGVVLATSSEHGLKLHVPAFVPFGDLHPNASTKRFVAGPLPPGPLLPEVERVTSANGGLEFGSGSTKCHLVSASRVNTPATELLTVNVHVALSPFCRGDPHIVLVM